MATSSYAAIGRAVNRCPSLAELTYDYSPPSPLVPPAGRMSREIACPPERAAQRLVMVASRDADEEEVGLLTDILKRVEKIGDVQLTALMTLDHVLGAALPEGVDPDAPCALGQMASFTLLLLGHETRAQLREAASDEACRHLEELGMVLHEGPLTRANVVFALETLQPLMAALKREGGTLRPSRQGG